MSSIILLADDSLTIQKVVELTFADTDYGVVAVSGGEELLQKLPECRPDLVICDIIMPGKDGYDVCQEIKSDPDTLHIPVILLTGTFEPFDHDRAVAAGCSEIITKPFEARRLVDTVERLLHGGPAEAAPAASEAEASPPPIPLAEEGAADGGGDFGISLDAVEPVVEETPRPFASGPEPDDAKPDEGLDFTATGFAEMEQAGREQAELVPPPPEHGLDFDTEPPGSADEDAQPEDEPFAGLQPAEAADEEVAAEIAAEPAEPSESIDEMADEVQEHAEDVREPAAEPPVPEADDIESPDEAPFIPPDMPPPVSPQPDESGEASTDPTMTVPVESYMPPTSPSIPDDFDAVVAEEAPQVDLVAEAEPEETAEPEPQEAAEAEPQEAAEPEPEETAEPEGEAPVEVQPSLADTAPLAAAEEPPVVVAEPLPLQEGLSEDDVDRIARRLLELAGDRIERIAWEVIPDMAEIVVRERIRELENDVERGTEPGGEA